MDRIKRFLLVNSILFCVFSLTASSLSTTYEDFTYGMSGRFKPEMFYGKNVSLLNNNNITDKIWFARHTLDFDFDFLYGEKTYGEPIAEFLFTLRNRGIWGNPESIAKTTEKETKTLDSVGRPHSHAIPRHVFWMREAWLRFDLNEFLNLDIDQSHKFTIGAFPFQLGRGIALGDAFAVGPEFLGFYSEGVVDQYAFGGLFEGDIIKDTLHYDLYTAILQNKSGGLGDTSAKVRGQEFGRLENPQRGFGKINFVVASRLKWQAFNNNLGELNLEPYALMNHDPEQKVEFTADASSKLGTFGLAGEYYGDKFEFGFDYAFNIGQQRVRGWDRNQVQLENRNGQVILVNSHVVDQNDQKIPFVPGSDAQILINSTNKMQQDESLNGKQIGTVNGVGFINGNIALNNKNNRYRNPFNNKYEGWMFVIDAAYWVYKRDLWLAVTAGITTGDQNPNFETLDQQYGGFIPLQEIYSGKRVKSAFILGSAGKLNRPLSAPTSVQAPSRFASAISNFTDLVFCGAGLKWEPSEWDRPLIVKPNALLFWKERPSNKFDALTKQDLMEDASTYLGGELNVFADYFVFKDLKLFCVSSLFIPGTFFKDIKGRPLTADQDAELDRLDKTGFSADRIPNIGDDIAYTFNLGLEFKF